MWKKSRKGFSVLIYALIFGSLIFSGCAGKPLPQTELSDPTLRELVEISAEDVPMAALPLSQDLDAAYEVLPEGAFVVTRSYLPAGAEETSSMIRRGVSGTWDTEMFPQELLEQATDFSLLEDHLAIGGRYSEEDLEAIVRKARITGPVTPASRQTAEGSDLFQSEFNYEFMLNAEKKNHSLTMLWGVWGENNALLAVGYLDIPAPVAE